MEHHGPTSWLEKIPFLPPDKILELSNSLPGPKEGLLGVGLFKDTDSATHVIGGIIIFLMILVLSLIANRSIRNHEKMIIPQKKLSVFTFFDVLIEGLYNLVIGILGHHGERQFALIAAIFVFVWFSNLLGLLPLSGSPSTSINTTFALGIVAFLYYNYEGIKAHGLAGYGKHFLMGLGLFGIPIAFFELISHVIRPVTLGIRLMMNLHIDHMLVGSFEQMGRWLLPVPLLLFGILVCSIQAFLFAVLTTVYVQMATEHEEEH